MAQLPRAMAQLPRVMAQLPRAMAQLPRVKIVLIGDAGVGKSALVARAAGGAFRPHYAATLGVDVLPTEFSVDGRRVILDLWDTAGQERFGGLADGYYLAADAAILVYANRLSRANAELWYEKFRRVAPQAAVVLCCNKSDIAEPQGRYVPPVVNFFNEVGPDHTHTVSAKTGHNWQAPFVDAAREALAARR